MTPSFPTRCYSVRQRPGPEVCYEAAGFKITRSEPVAFDVGLRAPLTGRYVVAEAAYRKEAILYWTRIGDALPVSRLRSEEHTSELQSLMRISYAVFCLKKKNITTNTLLSTI